MGQSSSGFLPRKDGANEGLDSGIVGSIEGVEIYFFGLGHLHVELVEGPLHRIGDPRPEPVRKTRRRGVEGGETMDDPDLGRRLQLGSGADFGRPGPIVERLPDHPSAGGELHADRPDVHDDEAQSDLLGDHRQGRRISRQSGRVSNPWMIWE